MVGDNSSDMLTTFRPNRPIQYILEESNFSIWYVVLYDLDIPREKMATLFANSGDPDQILCSVLSSLGLHCLPTTLIGSPD